MISYADNVFINCPFDEHYRPMFDTIVFTIIDCGFIPRCAREISDSDEVRLDKLVRLIKESKYSIHDISRTQPDPDSGLPRFNMPFEFGMFMGAKRFGDDEQKEKACLVMDTERYRYQQFISDIAGQDIRAHDDDLLRVAKCVRDWLLEKSKRTTIYSADSIFKRHERFKTNLPELCTKFNWDYNSLTYLEYVSLTQEWLKEQST